ncbi:MAG: hypothetical protein N2314_03850 [Brevinematales bacterium]|nr:hypothetical protein [Brevinematales bacterium]
MKRVLYPMEEWLYRAARRKHTPLPINFGIALACKHLPKKDDLLQALKEIEDFFPFSRARVLFTKHSHSLLTTEETGPIPLKEAEVPEIWEALASELGCLFDDPSLPLLRLSLYTSPQGNFLYAHFDHALVDGIGAIAWLKTLFLLLEGKKPPKPPLYDWREIISQHFQPSWETKYTQERLTKPHLWQTIHEILSEPRWPPSWHYRLFSKTLSPFLTHKLREKTRQEHTSVHAALAVSFLQAFYEKGYGHTRPQRSVLSPVNLRPLYSLSPEAYGLFNGTLRTSVDFSLSLDFWQRCRLFKQDLDAHRITTDFLYFHYRAEKDLEYALQHGFRRRQRFDTRQDYDLSLTNIGHIEKFSSNVTAIYGPIAQGLPTETVLGVCTYQDTMTLSWVSKPEFMPDEESLFLFERGLEILLSHLA